MKENDSVTPKQVLDQAGFIIDNFPLGDGTHAIWKNPSERVSGAFAAENEIAVDYMQSNDYVELLNFLTQVKGKGVRVKELGISEAISTFERKVKSQVSLLDRLKYRKGLEFIGEEEDDSRLTYNFTFKEVEKFSRHGLLTFDFKEIYSRGPLPSKYLVNVKDLAETAEPTQLWISKHCGYFPALTIASDKFPLDAPHKPSTEYTIFEKREGEIIDSIGIDMIGMPEFEGKSRIDVHPAYVEREAS